MFDANRPLIVGAHALLVAGDAGTGVCHPDDDAVVAIGLGCPQPLHATGGGQEGLQAVLDLIRQKEQLAADT